MSKDVTRLAVIAGVLIIALVVAAVVYRRGESESEAARLAERAAADSQVFERPHSRTLGPDDAEVTIVEFLDPECEACRAMHPLVKRVLKQYPRQVRLVVRYMPLHGNSVYAAGALEAAGAQGKFWEMLEMVFANQPMWGSHAAPRPELIPGYARDLGLDMAAFDRFMTAGDYKELVDRDRQDGIELGVKGTPSFFVNQKRLPSLGYNELKAMVEEQLRGSG